MNSRTPKWQRKGYKSEAEYRARLSVRAKTRDAALAATRAKGYHRAILETLWKFGDYDSSQVTVTKQQLMAKVGCSRDTVQAAMKMLRAEGSIAPIKNWQGGRHVPTVWQLKVSGQGDSPLDKFLRETEEANDREAAWRYLKSKFGPVEALRIMDERGETPPTDD